MRRMNRAGLAAGAIAGAIVLAGCGSSSGSLLSPGAATQLTADLDQASSALAAYNCLPADTALTNFRDDVSQLTGVNSTLVRMLSEGASRIATLASERCPTGGGPDTTSTPESVTTPSTATTASTSVTSTNPDAITTASQTSTGNGSGGGALTTASSPSATTAPTTTAPSPPVTTPDSGGAGLNGSGAVTGSGGGTAQ